MHLSKTSETPSFLGDVVSEGFGYNVDVISDAILTKMASFSNSVTLG